MGKSADVEEGSLLTLGFAHDEEVTCIMSALEDFNVRDSYSVFYRENNRTGDWSENVEAFADWLVSSGLAEFTESEFVKVTSWMTDHPEKNGFNEAHTTTNRPVTY